MQLRTLSPHIVPPGSREQQTPHLPVRRGAAIAGERADRLDVIVTATSYWTVAAYMTTLELEGPSYAGRGRPR
jgi:hypothetical protein